MYSTPFWSKGRTTTPSAQTSYTHKHSCAQKSANCSLSPLTQLDVLRCLMQNTVHYGTAEGQSTCYFLIDVLESVLSLMGMRFCLRRKDPGHGN